EMGPRPAERFLTRMSDRSDTKPPKLAGPPVWLDLDQKALDDAYDQTVYAPNFAQLNRRRETNSAAVRERLGPPRRVSYGDTPVEQLDIYRATQSDAPILVLIHG